MEESSLLIPWQGGQLCEMLWADGTRISIQGYNPAQPNERKTNRCDNERRPEFSKEYL
jgi:hypothetical protein